MRRVVSVVAIFLSTIALSFVLSLLGDLYPDEWICIAFIDIIFLMLILFELEYERAKLLFSNNRRTDYVRFALVFLFCCMLCACFGILPLYSRPVIVLAILLCLAGNEILSLVCGSYFCILLAVTVSGDYYELICELFLVLAGVMLARMLREDKLQICIYIIIICLSIVTPGIFYYMSTKEFSEKAFVAGGAGGILSAFVGFVCARIFRPKTSDEVNDKLIAIISDDFSAVKELKEHSFSEYNHSNFVSTVAVKAAKAAGLNTALCAAGGFYYRIGQWQKKKSILYGVERAEAMYFPEQLTNILYEYYGKLRKPQTPESALVHMVDALIVKLDHIKADVADSEWNHDILIIQLLNELSASGIYDESGLSMNHFLKIRDYLKKEELLK